MTEPGVSSLGTLASPSASLRLGCESMHKAGFGASCKRPDGLCIALCSRHVVVALCSPLAGRQVLGCPSWVLGFK